MHWIWYGIGAALAALLLLRLSLTRFLRAQIFRTKPPVSGTPADQGLEYIEEWIEVDGRKLQAWLIEAPAPAQEAPALLLFQGGDDVIGELPHLLKYLHQHGFALMCFDYGGNGNSSGQPTPEAFHADSMAAFQLFQSFAQDRAKFLWGFSAGTARLLTVLPEIQDQVAGAFLVGPFASLRLVAGDRLPIPEPLLPLFLPDDANNLEWIRRVDQTLVTIIHSRDDELAPLHHAHKLLVAGGDNTELVTLAGLKHNDCWQPIHDAYWQPVLKRTGLA